MTAVRSFDTSLTTHQRTDSCIYSNAVNTSKLDTNIWMSIHSQKPLQAYFSVQPSPTLVSTVTLRAVIACEKWPSNWRLRVFDNSVLRQLFWPRREEVTWLEIKLHIEKLHDLYCSPNITRVIRSERIRWAEHVARIDKLKILGQNTWRREGTLKT